MIRSSLRSIMQALSPRTRLAALAGLLLIGLFLLAELQALNEDRIRVLHLERALLVQAAEARVEPGWEVRAGQAVSALDALENEILRAPTAGAAAAQLQEAMRGVLSSANALQPRIQVDPEPVETGPVATLRYELSAILPAASVLPVLEALAAPPHAIVWSEVQLVFTLGRRANLTLRGYVPVMLEASGTDSVSGEAPA